MAAPAARPVRSGGTLAVTTLVVAVLALVVALAGVVLSAIALGRSDQTTQLATKTNNQPLPPTADAIPTEPTADPTATEPTDQPTDPGPTTSANDISPTAQFATAYEGQKLRVRSVACQYGGSQTYVDLDEPRITGVNETNTEFGYAGCDPGSLHTELAFAQVSGPTATPKDCLETIRTDPGRSPLAPKQGMTLCIVTDQNAAVAQGLTHKLVFVTVDSISVDGGVGVLNVTVKAWIVPQ